MRGRRRGKKGGGEPAGSAAAAEPEPEPELKGADRGRPHIRGGEPDMGWRYRGEVGALVGRGGRGGHKWGNPFQSVI